MSFRFSSAPLYFAICDRIISCEWWYSCDGRNLHFNRIAGRCNIKSCVMTAVKRQLGDGRPRRRALPDYLSRSATRPAYQLTVVSIDFPWPSSSCLTSFSKFIVWPQSNWFFLSFITIFRPYMAFLATSWSLFNSHFLKFLAARLPHSNIQVLFAFRLETCVSKNRTQILYVWDTIVVADLNRIIDANL